MTHSDLTNKLAENHNLTTGRAEMIISIIVERITEKLLTGGHVRVENLGTFRVAKNSLSEMIMRDNVLNKNRIIFEPSDEFLNKINDV